MTPLLLVIFLLVGLGAALIFGEMLLPTHGILTSLGGCALAAALVLLFTVNLTAGLLVFLFALLISPLALSMLVKVWSASPAGRHVILHPASLEAAPSPVRIGQIGITMTELRPMGECEFGPTQRLEASAELGMIRPGTTVRVVSFSGGLPTVRAVNESNA